MMIDLICANFWAILPEALQSLSTISDINTGFAPKVAQSPFPASFGADLNMAVLPIHGVILPYSSPFASYIGASCLDALSQQFCIARDNPDIRAIVLDIDSPGGMVTGVHAFSQQVFAARPIKPIIAKVSGLAASAAYWIAASCSKILLDPTAMVGSIGVVASYTDDKEKHKKAGVLKTDIVSTQSPHKRPDSSTPEGRNQLQAQVDQLAQVFIEAVALYRNTSPETVLKEFGQGGLCVGKTAVTQGMADGLLNSNNFSSMTSTLMTTGDSMMTIETVHPPATPETSTPDASTGYEQGFQAGLLLGKSQERARIQAVEAQSLPGHEALIATLKFDGVSNGSDAALQILAAEKSQRLLMQQALQQDAPLPLSPLEATTALSLTERCAREWADSSSVRAEFHSLEAYTAYREADAKGYIKEKPHAK